MEKTRENIELMFDEIAPTYDKLNHLFTLNIDMKWRKEIIKNLKKSNFSGENVLDLASGTGDLTAELLKLNASKIYSADISKKMLDIQKIKIKDKRLTLIKLNDLKLPFEGDYFDLVTVGFGVRNFENLPESLREIRRVLRKNGRLIVLEMFKSDSAKARLFNIYFGKIMPFVGNKISKSEYAYNYLFKSVKNFYSVDEFVKICENCSFELENQKNNFLKIVNTVSLLAV